MNSLFKKESSLNFFKKILQFLQTTCFTINEIEINYFEALILTIAVITDLIYFLLLGNRSWIDYWLFLTLPFGVITALALSKKLSFANYLLIIDSIFYSIPLFFINTYALAVASGILIPLILIATIKQWNQNQNNKNEITTKKLHPLIGVGLVTLITIITTLIYTGIIYLFNIQINVDFPLWYFVLDGVVAALFVIAYIFASLRYRENFYLFFLTNSFKIILFSSAIALGLTNSREASFYLIIAVIYLFNAIYGILNWIK